MNYSNDDILLEESPVYINDITPRDLLSFAKSILIVIALLFLLGGVAELVRPQSGVFDTCKTVLPPVATLVIGFYFGKSS